MRNFFVAAACLSSVFASADDGTFSRSHFTTFYDQFFCEEKDALSSVNLTTPCSFNPNPYNPVPPPNPPAPPFKTELLPVILVNDSGLPDDQVFVVMTAKDQATQTQGFIQIDASSGVGTLVTANPGDNALNYSLSLSQLPSTSTGHVFYVPLEIGGAVWFSMNNKLNMPVNAPHDIVQPNFLSPGDPNYNTNFDIFEITYTSLTTPNVAADATAVSFFSIPLYGYISTPSSVNSNTGLFQKRSYVLAQAAATFVANANSPELGQWNNLFLRNGGNILRLVSPGKGISYAASPYFDINYLDNPSSYTYSYINDIWTGLTSFYRNNPLKLTIPNGSLETYTGVVNANNTITLTSSPSGYEVVFSAPTTSTPTTTFDIFSGITLVQSDTSPNAADGVQLFKLFEEAIIAGLVPTADTLSNPYLTSNQSNYYTVNPNLSSRGQSSGPWYDLYSKALHKLGYIYTFAFDEPLWPQVQIFSNTLIENSTYIGITIGAVD